MRFYSDFEDIVAVLFFRQRGAFRQICNVLYNKTPPNSSKSVNEDPEIKESDSLPNSGVKPSSEKDGL
jgi:hypothetical protein